MLYLYCVCYVVFIYRACCVVLSCMLFCTYSYVCICVLWQGRTALADCPEFKLLIKSNQDCLARGDAGRGYRASQCSSARRCFTG